MNRPARLDHARAKNWVKNNAGDKILRRYRRYFGVDLVTAALELRALGVSISEARMGQLQQSMATQSKAAKRRRVAAQKAEAANLQAELDRCTPIWSDEPYPFPIDEWEITQCDEQHQTRPAATAKPSVRIKTNVEDDDIPF